MTTYKFKNPTGENEKIERYELVEKRGVNGLFRCLSYPALKIKPVYSFPLKDLVKVSIWDGCVCDVETCCNWEGNMGGEECADCSDSFENRKNKKAGKVAPCNDPDEEAAKGIEEIAESTHAGTAGAWESNPAFTPGPWKATAWGQTISIDAPEIMGITNINSRGNHNAGIPSAEDTANGRLIAACPDLLTALENILAEFVHVPGDIKGNKDRTTAARIIGGPHAALARAREAIEKAKGGIISWTETKQSR